MVKLKPFIKWAGGKGKLLPQIRQMYPQGLGKTITKYAEPFGEFVGAVSPYYQPIL